MDIEYWITTAIAVVALLVASLTWIETKRQRLISNESLATARGANQTASQALQLSAAGSVQLVLRSVPRKPSPIHETWFIQNKGTVPAKDVEVEISFSTTDENGVEQNPHHIETKQYSLIPVGGSISFFLLPGHRVSALRYKTPYSAEVLRIPQQVIDTEDLIRRHYRDDFRE